MVERRKAWGVRVSSSKVGLWKVRSLHVSGDQFPHPQGHEALLAWKSAEGLLQFAANRAKAS